MLTHLFTAYKTVAFEDFLTYMRTKRNAYNEGDETITAVNLMKYAAAKYKTLVDTDKCQNPNPTKEKVIVLTSQVNKLKFASPKLKDGRGRNQQGNGRPKSKKDPVPGSMGPNMDRRLPLKELNKYVMWNGNPWYYCHKDSGGKFPGKWRCHVSQDCRYDSIMAQSKTKGTKRRTDLNVDHHKSLRKKHTKEKEKENSLRCKIRKQLVAQLTTNGYLSSDSE